MRRKLIQLMTLGAIGLGAVTVAEAGMFDMMNPSRWFGGGDRDYDRHRYGYGGFGGPYYGHRHGVGVHRGGVSLYFGF